MVSNRKTLMLALPIMGIGAIIVLGIAGFFLWRVLSHFFYPVEAVAKSAPEQPINFSHVTHAQQLSIDCTFCHRTVTEEKAASVPAVQQCMFCHQQVTGTTDAQKTEIAKLRQFAENEEPINWVRVHRLPDHVQFVHSVHVQRLPQVLNLGEDYSIQAVCATCHGKVWEMKQVRQVRALKMGDCVDCHRQFNAPTDCVVCHY